MRFYVLNPGYGNQFYFGDVVSEEPSRAEMTDGLRSFRGTVSVNIIKGGRPGDFLRVNDLLYIVSERVLEVLAEHGFREYSTYPVQVTGGKGDLPVYRGLVFRGKGGHSLDKESGTKFGPLLESGERSVVGRKRLVFTEDQWDGSDLFYLEDMPMTGMVTERVKDAFKKHKITNYELVPFEEYSWGIY